MPHGAMVLLHMCAQNPTGIDPRPDQWREIASLLLKKRLITLCDFAYQGFASGDIDLDAAALRMLVDQRVPLLLCQSFSKNMGLYGERVGALTVICESPDEAARVLSQLKVLDSHSNFDLAYNIYEAR